MMAHTHLPRGARCDCTWRVAGCVRTRAAQARAAGGHLRFLVMGLFDGPVGTFSEAMERLLVPEDSVWHTANGPPVRVKPDVYVRATPAPPPRAHGLFGMPSARSSRGSEGNGATSDRGCASPHRRRCAGRRPCALSWAVVRALVLVALAPCWERHACNARLWRHLDPASGLPLTRTPPLFEPKPADLQQDFQPRCTRCGWACSLPPARARATSPQHGGGAKLAQRAPPTPHQPAAGVCSARARARACTQSHMHTSPPPPPPPPPPNWGWG